MDANTSLCNAVDLTQESQVPGPMAGSYRRRDLWVIMTAIGVLTIVIAGAIIVRAVWESQTKLCHANLLRLYFALDAYHEAHGHFPAPSLARSDGTPLLSWRVALLPYLGYGSLYERFHLDEPWDSPHNRSLLAEMPRELNCPGAAGHGDGRTGYLVIVGPDIEPYSVSTPFDSKRGVDLREITDGTAMTVLVLETDALVPWTKPDDLRWSPDGPLPHLSSPHAEGAHALFGDGHIRFLKPTTRPDTLRALLTANGGEVLGGG